MKKILFFITMFALLAMPLGAQVYADESDGDFYPWRNHQAPFEFTFGNMIDTHQQSSFDKNGVLHGFIYIRIIGVAEDGIPIAEKANCEENAEGCVVGWVIKAVPVSAELVNKGPRVWLMDPEDLPQEPGYTHFHWLETPPKPHGLNTETVYEGYLMKRMAARTFYWLGGSGGGQGGGNDSGGGGCSGHDSGDEGGCSGHDSGDEGGCGGHEREDVTHTDEGGSDMGGPPDGGDMGGPPDGGDMGGGCSDGDHTDEGGCSGHDGGSGSSGHGGRLVVEGLDSHSNIVTIWDGVWNGCGGDD